MYTKDTRYINCFYTRTKINGYTYQLEYVKEDNKYCISASSGTKRKDLEIAEAKDKKSKGGLEAIYWYLQRLINFKEENNITKPSYIIIFWSDTRRRDIYSRLLRYGFTFQMDYGKKCLMKRI